jgi:antitoxin (DNA-binding transcriptional repressor) of toxin-antitoxin stability system
VLPATESDNLIEVREVTATEAARRFSALLSAVERDGETFVVTRGGRVIARIEPAVGTSGRAVKALLRHYPADDAWQQELSSIRGLLDAQDRAWPG